MSASTKMTVESNRIDSPYRAVRILSGRPKKELIRWLALSLSKLRPNHGPTFQNGTSRFRSSLDFVDHSRIVRALARAWS
jgi:hypothetical protein